MIRLNKCYLIDPPLLSFFCLYHLLSYHEVCINPLLSRFSDTLLWNDRVEYVVYFAFNSWSILVGWHCCYTISMGTVPWWVWRRVAHLSWYRNFLKFDLTIVIQFLSILVKGKEMHLIQKFTWRLPGYQNQIVLAALKDIPNHIYRFHLSADILLVHRMTWAQHCLDWKLY